MRLRSLLCFFIIGIKTKAEIKPDLAINYICYNLNNVFSDLKRSIIKFDIYFNLVFKKFKRKEYEKIQRLFFKKSYYCLKINEKLILATQNDDSLIRDKIVKKMKGKYGKYFIDKFINEYLKVLISFRYFLTSIGKINFDIAREMIIICDSLEYELNALKRYLISLRNK